MHEGLVIPLDNEKDRAMWEEINEACSSGYLADCFGKLTQTINCHQNWNSYAAGAGTSISNLALMLVNIGANNNSANFEYTLPHASELTGSFYGHSDNIYSQYMVHDNSFNPGILDNEDHMSMIYNMFQQQVSTAEYPEPCHMKGHRPDWIIKHRGAPLLYGEGKAMTGTNESDTHEGVMLLVYLCMNQLNFNDFALGMITTNSRMQFICIEKCAEGVQRCHVKICGGSIYSKACKVKFFNDTPALCRE